MVAPAEWGVLNDTLCTVLLYAPTIVVFASVLTLVATCFERYFAIVHPLESRMLHSKTRVMYILIAVWVIPGLAAIPFLKPAEAITHELSSAFGTIRRQACMQSLDDDFRKYYYTFLFLVFYSLPLLIITGTCIRIACCLLTGIKLQREGTLRRQEINRRKIAKMVIVVALAFAICWTPYFTISMVTQYHPVNYFEHQNYYFTMLCINLFAFTNSCVNPFIYACMSVRFRNGFKSILRPVVCGHPAFETRPEIRRHHCQLNNVHFANSEQQAIRKRYLNTKARPKKVMNREMGSATPTSHGSYSDMQLTLLRLGSLRTSFSGMNVKLINNAKNFNFSNILIPASPPLETTRTSRLASISTSRRSSYNASKQTLNTPTVEDILTCPTYKHWAREMERTELFQKTSYALPVPESRERASSFSGPNTNLKDSVGHLNKQSRVKFGGVIEHSHSAIELSSRRDQSEIPDPNQQGVSPDTVPQPKRHEHYCLDLAISFDRRLSATSLNEPWARRFSNVSNIDPNDSKESETCGKYLNVLRGRKMSNDLELSPPQKSSGTTLKSSGTNLTVLPQGVIRRSSLLSNKELSTCDEEPELIGNFLTGQHVRRSTSDTILSLFPAHEETFL
ncbi:QRFP-like peptide receptor [Nymphon striatum]|nr:QRFP-like peptide receptor [Nymphon striatum]